ncbi:iron-sulfur cluster repair protein YtfE [Propionivibrio sp.]|uniref:iron-sulfur cluster repair protein YtfE n=1 Tax=Propionivibrio sp. TaxID=2212460 RepID=UPI0039E356E6
MNLHEQPIGQLACALPGATRIFHQHKLDFCCGGHVSLREAAAKRGVDLAALLKQLEPLQGGETQIRDWRSAPAAELIDYILRRYHERHREEIPELIRLARRVEHVHATRPDCPAGLADHLDAMFQELLSHMMKEEQVLFPMLLAGREAEAQSPISMMRYEHDQHGEALARLEALTDDITAPADACNTWRALYAGLAKLREDLMQHIHLENNILFINAGHIV